MTKFYDAVEPHMDVLSSDGRPVGKVDHQEGVDRIKLTRNRGEHHYINWDWVDRVEDGKLHLNVSQSELQRSWQKDPSAHIR
jgi:hypothetical protein